LLGLIRHVAKVERTWFRQRAAGEDVEPLYDLSLGKDHDFDDVDPNQAEAAFARLQDEWRRADAAVAGIGFDDTFDVGGDEFSLRMAYVHMIGEYSRHNGHADLLRESIDGVTGRRPESDVFLHLLDRVRDEAVRLAVNRVRSVRVGSVDQAEDLAVRLVDPVPQVPNVEFGLRLQVSGVRLGDVVDRDRPSSVWTSMNSGIACSPRTRRGRWLRRDRPRAKQVAPPAPAARGHGNTPAPAKYGLSGAAAMHIPIGIGRISVGLGFTRRRRLVVVRLFMR
jgi:hypothetical protein